MGQSRYFKATDGERTYFRASSTRVYLSLGFDRGGSPTFSANPPSKTHPHAVVEIDKVEYNNLVKLKMERVERRNRSFVALGKVAGKDFYPGGDSPSDSWIRNIDLED